MAAINPGTSAPTFSLPTASGTIHQLSEALRVSPVVVLAFYKANCPACQVIFPYLERLHQRYPSITIWGVSQDDTDATAAFARMYGVTFPVLLDEQLESTVEYGLTNVPSLFVVQPDGTVRQTIVGFVRKDLEQLNIMMAAETGLTVKPLFSEADDIPDLKPGCGSKQPRR